MNQSNVQELVSFFSEIMTIIFYLVLGNWKQVITVLVLLFFLVLLVVSDPPRKS